MNRLLTDNILNNAKIMASVPLSQNKFSDASILLMLKDILDTQIFPILIKAQGNNNEITFAVTANSEGEIEVPERAYLSGITRLKNGDLCYLQATEEDFAYSVNTYYFIGDIIKVKEANQEFHLTYTLRPPELLLEIDAPKVLSFNPSTRIVEVDKDTYATDMDVIKPNGYHRSLNQGRTTTTTATVFTLGGTVVPSVGDYIVEAGQSPVIPIPQEVIGLVVRALSNRILMDIPDEEGLRAGLRVEEIMYTNVLNMLKPRGKRASAVSRKPILNTAFRNRRL